MKIIESNVGAISLEYDEKEHQLKGYIDTGVFCEMSESDFNKLYELLHVIDSDTYME